MKSIANVLRSALVILLAQSLVADEQAAIAKVEEFGGQVLGIAQNTEGVRVLIPPKTFEGRVLTDDDLAVLKEIDKIVELDLKNAGIGDGGIAHLSTLADVERLHLEKTKVSDDGLESLKGLTKLKYLNLYGTGVTDAGLAKLKSLTQLETLYLWQTKVTFEAAKKFHDEQAAGGNNKLEINLGWDKEILSATRLSALKEQRAKLEAEANGEAPAAKEVAATKKAEGSSVFVEYVLPILTSSCVDCHGPNKQKAGLRLDTIAEVMKGSKGDAVVVAGNPNESSLYQRIILPADDGDIMPPKGDPLTKAQTDLIKLWIVSGAQ